MKDCFLVKRLKIAAQEKDSQRKKKDGILKKFKDLNAIVEAKIQHALKKKIKSKTPSSATTIEVNAFKRFRQLEVKDSDEDGELKDPPSGPSTVYSCPDSNELNSNGDYLGD